MPKNKALYEYLYNKNILNKEKNYDYICSEIERSINVKKKAFNMLVLSFTIIMVTMSSSSIYAKRKWNKEYEEYKKRQIVYSITTRDSMINEELINKLDMDYLYSEGIGVKIDSLIFTNDSIQMDISFKVKDNSLINLDEFSFGIGIFDENNNIYIAKERLKYVGKAYNYKKMLCKELGLNYNKRKDNPKSLIGSWNLVQTNSKDNIHVFTFQGQTIYGFPKSKELNIRIFDLGYSLADKQLQDKDAYEILDSEDFTLSNSEWQFKIDCLENFYDDELTKLKLSEEIDGFKLEKAELSSTGLLLYLEQDQIVENLLPNKLCIINERDDMTLNLYSYAEYEKNLLKILFYDPNGKSIEGNLYLYLNIPEYNINEKVELLKYE